MFCLSCFRRRAIPIPEPNLPEDPVQADDDTKNATAVPEAREPPRTKQMSYSRSDDDGDDNASDEEPDPFQDPTPAYTPDTDSSAPNSRSLTPAPSTDDEDSDCDGNGDADPSAPPSAPPTYNAYDHPPSTQHPAFPFKATAFALGESEDPVVEYPQNMDWRDRREVEEEQGQFWSAIRYGDQVNRGLDELGRFRENRVLEVSERWGVSVEEIERRGERGRGRGGESVGEWGEEEWYEEVEDEEEEEEEEEEWERGDVESEDGG